MDNTTPESTALTVTLTPATSTIDGSATLTLTTGQGVDLYSDGSNYFTQPGKGATSPGGTSGQLQTNNGSGGFGAVAAPAGAVVGTSDTQTLTNKSISGPQINSGAVPLAQIGASPASHGVPVDVAGTSTYKVIPDCIDSGGNHINYTQSTDAFSCGTTSSGGGGGSGLSGPGYKSGLWYLPLGQALGTGSPGTSLLTAYCTMGQVGGATNATIQSLAVKSNTNGGNVQLAIYNNDFSSGIARPGTLIDSTPNISVASGAPIAVTGNLNATHSIAPGFYWLCLQSDNNSTFSYVAFSATSNQYIPTVGASNIFDVLGAGSLDSVFFSTGIASFGTWPTGVGATYTSGFTRSPLIAFKFSSVP